MVKLPLMAYIFFVSWTGAFALSPWFRLHYLVAAGALAMAALAVAMRGQFNVSAYRSDDGWVMAFLLLYITAALANPNDSSINYVATYVFVLLGLYMFTKGVLVGYLTSRQIYAANLYGVAGVAVFLSINFILTTAGVADLQAMIPRLRDTTASYAGMFVRGYGFSTEPGIVAYYLNTLGPLALWYLWSGAAIGRIYKLLLTALIALGWVVTFSAGGVFGLAAGLSIAALILFIRKSSSQPGIEYRKLIRLFSILVLLVTGMIYAIVSPIMNHLLRPIYMKLTFSQELNTATDRLIRYEAAYREILEYPILGRGPGYFSSVGEGSTLNWYLMLAAESGVLSLLFILMFFLFVTIRIVEFRHPSRFAVLVGFVAACSHLMLMATSGYLHPFIWLLVAIFYAQMAHYRRQLV